MTTTSNNVNALMKAIKIKSAKIIELIFTHHSDVESILCDAFIDCIKQAKIETAKYLLDKSMNRSSVLNYNGANNYTPLMLALQHKRAECLEFIVEELKQDVIQQQQSRLNEEKHDEKHDEYEDEKFDVHPMYLAINDFGDTIFHVALETECSMEIISILESVLNKDIIHKHLSTKDNFDTVPLADAFLNNGIEVIEWILNQFHEPLEKYYMIVQRNKLHETMLHKTTSNKSQMIEETKPFMAKVITECLQQIDVNNIDMLTLKDTFQYTISWGYPALQSLILEKIPENQHHILFSREDMLWTDGQTLIHQVIKADNIEMCNVVLSAISNPKQITGHNQRGDNALVFGIQQRAGYNTMKLVLNKLSNNNELLFEFMTQSAFGNAYTKKDKYFQKLLLSYLTNDNEKTIAIHSAIKSDKNLTWIPSILSTLKPSTSEKIKYKLLHSLNSEGYSLLRSAAGYDYRKVVEWMVNDEIKENDDLILTKANDTKHVTPLLSMCQSDEYYDIIQNIMQKLSAKNRLNELLRMSFDRESVITKCSEAIVKLIGNNIVSTLATIDGMTDIDNILLPLFKFAVERCKIPTDSIKIIQVILSKISSSNRIKLLNNYENKQSWNALKYTATTERKEVFKYLLKNVAQTAEIIKILNDENNPSFQNYTVLQQCCINGDMDCFNLVLNTFDENKENIDEELLNISDHNNKNMLFLAIENNNIDIAVSILKRIKNDEDVIKIFNQETKDSNKNIFDVAGSAKCKDQIKKSIIAILKNVKTNQIKFESFAPYFRWLIKENDVDSIKQLLHIFNKDKTLINKLLKTVKSGNKQSALHIACSQNNIEMVEYLLSFAKDEKQKEELLLLQDITGMNLLMVACKNNNIECVSLILGKLKSNAKLLSQIILTSNSSNQTCLDLCSTECCSLIIEHNTAEEIFKILYLSSIKKKRDNVVENILSKTQHLKIKKQTLFNYI
eukprot:277939_1